MIELLLALINDNVLFWQILVGTLMIEGVLWLIKMGWFEEGDMP